MKMTLSGRKIPPYMFVNFFLAFAIISLLIAGNAVRTWHSWAGVADRFSLATYCLFNGVCWTLGERRKYPVAGIIMLTVGIGALITALMGYGFGR